MRFKLCQIARIDVFLHWSYILAPIYIVYRLKWERDFPWSVVGGLLVLLAALSICVLLHEFGHAMMARWYGVSTKDIIITPIGGLARLERMPREPRQEMMISLAGPMVNLAIAAILAAGLLIGGGAWVPEVSIDVMQQFVSIMLWINLALFLFNLIPAFPMDGGRILRSLLAFAIPHYQATLIAGMLGQLLAVGFSVYGFVSAQYLLILVGAFVFLAARFEMNQARLLVRPSDSEPELNA